MIYQEILSFAVFGQIKFKIAYFLLQFHWFAFIFNVSSNIWFPLKQGGKRRGDYVVYSPEYGIDEAVPQVLHDTIW